jgi:hypothetical protein
MRRADNLLGPPQRVLGRQGLGAKDVQPSAPAMRLSLIADRSASSSNTPPRAKLITKADGFIAARTLALKMLFVSWELGTSTTRKSASPAACSRSARVTMRSNPGRERGVLVTPMTAIPNALQRVARSEPITPTSSMVTVFQQRRFCGILSQTPSSLSHRYLSSGLRRMRASQLRVCPGTEMQYTVWSGNNPRAHR